MKKRKILKRALPAFLAVMLILSVFVVGASAATAEDFGLCSCILGQEHVFTADQYESFEVSNAGYYKLVNATCKSCGTVYKFKVNYWESLVDYGADSVSVVLQISDDGESISAITEMRQGGDAVDGDSVFLTKDDIQVVPRGNDGDMVGDMVSTITTTIGGMLKGIGNTLVSFFDNVVLNAEGKLTTFSIWVLAFLGVSFGLGAIGFVIGKVRK